MTGDGGGLGDLGRDIQRRRLALGMEIQELAREAGVDRGRLSILEKGGSVRATTAAAVQRALDRLEQEMSGPYDEAAESNVVTFRLRGNFGVDVTLQGPVDNLDDLEASVTRLLRTIQDNPQAPDEG